jgi:hypothetical protein
LCGKYKRMKHRGVICDKCGVGSHPVPCTPGAPGTHRAGQPLLACLVFQGPAQPHRTLARYHAA